MRGIDVIGQLTDFYPGEFPPLALENTEARVLTGIVMKIIFGGVMW